MTDRSSMTGLILAIGLILTLTACPAVAQTLPMRVDVPFDFLMGDRQLPAGEYVVLAYLDSRRIEFRSRSTSEVLFTSAITAHRPDTAVDTGKLVFEQHGDIYVLRKVWTRGQSQGHQLLPSKMERRLAKVKGTVEVAALHAGAR